MSFLCYLDGYILVYEIGYSFYGCIDFGAFSLFFCSSNVFPKDLFLQKCKGYLQRKLHVRLATLSIDSKV